MRVNRFFKILAVVFVLALLTVGTAAAGTISYSTSYGPQSTDFLTTLTLPDWDPALYPGQVLTGVTLTFDFSDNVNVVTLTNNSGDESETFQITLDSDVYTGPQTTPTLTPHVLSGPPDSLAPNEIAVPLFVSGTITLGIKGSGNCPFGTPSESCSIVQYDPGIATGTSSVNVNPANFAYYTGSGSFTTGAVTQAFSSFVGGGNNINLTISDSATMSETVTYTYADAGVPEPATMAMFGSALVGLGLLGRKRFSR